MRRVHFFAAWLAIAALLTGGLLPAAVAAAATPENGSPRALCGTASGNPLHGRTTPALPSHPCTLCAVCAGGALGVLPSRAGVAAISSESVIQPALVRSAAAETGRPAYAAARPRAPPEAIS